MRPLSGDLIARLDQLAEDDPDCTIIIELLDGVDESARLTPATLLGRSVAVALALRERHLGPSDVVLLIASSPVEFLIGLFGCLRAGVIAAPIGFPRRREHLSSRLEPVRANAGAVAVIAGTPQDDAEREALALLTAGNLPVLQANLPMLDSSTHRPLPVASHDIAYLQYTSGSTREPRGVIVTHANLVANLGVIAHLLRFDDDTVIVNWNPLTHDMGLVMGALSAIGFGLLSVLIPPLAFIRRPISWLRAIERYRGTHGFSPNFGYDLLVDRTTPEDRRSLDVSSMRVWLNGAEPVRLRTRDRFLEAFEENGVQATTWRPAYGLAEATVLVSATPIDDQGRVVWIDSAALEDHQVVHTTPDAPGSRAVCADGVLGPGFDAAICDPSTMKPLPSDRVGELWLRGPSVSPGYWRGTEATAETFGQKLAGYGSSPWLRTGDLAFWFEDQLFVCGRLKDLILINGRNLYPQDIEMTADLAHEAVRPGGVAAFAIDDDAAEAIVLLVEVEDPSDEATSAEVETAVRAAVLREFEVRVAEIVFVGPRGVPKTSSGKVQRSASREIYQRLRSGARSPL